MITDFETVTKNESKNETKGLVDAADRILRELIRTPKFKDGLMILLSSIDPSSARSLVRTLFWEDPGLFMSILGSLPGLMNLGAEALAEVAVQMNALPAPLLHDLLERVVAGIDGASAGEAAGGLVGLALSLNPAGEDSDITKSLSALGSGFGRAYKEAAGEATLTGRLDAWMASAAAKARDKESATYAFIRSAGEALRNNPDFVENVLKPLLAPALEGNVKKERDSGKKPAKPKPNEKE